MWLECDMAAGARPADLSIWVSDLLIYWDFHAQPSLGFRKNGPKKEQKTSSEQQFSEWKWFDDALDQSRIRILSDCFQLIRRQCDLHVCRRASLKAQHSNCEEGGPEQQKTTPGTWDDEPWRTQLESMWIHPALYQWFRLLVVVV